MKKLIKFLRPARLAFRFHDDFLPELKCGYHLDGQRRADCPPYLSGGAIMTLRGLKRAAAYAEVSEGTIRQWIGQGLHHQMAGNVLIVTTEAIDAWKRGETPAPSGRNSWQSCAGSGLRWTG